MTKTTAFAALLAAVCALPARPAMISTTAIAGANTVTGGSTASTTTSFTDGAYTYSARASVTAMPSFLDAAVRAIINGPSCILRETCPAVSVLRTEVDATESDQLFVFSPTGGGFLKIFAVGSTYTDENSGAFFSINGQDSYVSRLYPSFPQLIPFTNGVPIPVRYTAFVASNALLGMSPGIGRDPLQDQQADLLFQINIAVLDQNNNPTPFSYYSASGSRYGGGNGAFLPEPSTGLLVLVGAGFMMLALSRLTKAGSSERVA